MKGAFIVFEGIDGCGKTIQMNLLREFLEKRGHKVKITDEPSKTIIGDLVKAVAKIDERFFPLTDALFFAADRAEHTKRIIEPALELGYIILCERYVYSTYAYQTSQGLDLEWLKEINANALAPDLVIVLDIPARVSKERRLRELLYEEEMGWKFEKMDFLRKVRKKYVKLAKNDPKALLIDGTKPIVEIHEEVVNNLPKFLK